MEKYTDDELKKLTEEAGYQYVGFHRQKNSQLYVDFICPKHEQKGIQSVLLESIKRKRCCCGACNGNNRTTEEFIEMVHEKCPNIDVIGEYTGARQNVKVRCNICGTEYEAKAYNLLAGYNCMTCRNNNYKIKPPHFVSIDEKLRKLQECHPDIEFSNIPRNARDKVHCKCKICNTEWDATYVNLTKKTAKTGCPGCATSVGENNIKSYLDKKCIKYETEKTYEDLKDIRELRFDFYLIDYNVLIEFDGEQHYFPWNFGVSDYDALKRFENLKKHDTMKNDYCKKNNIPLIRIPYWERGNVECFLFEKLNELNIQV